MKAMGETEWDEKGAFLRCTRTTDVILCYSASVKCALGAARFLLGYGPLATDAAAIETNGPD